MLHLTQKKDSCCTCVPKEKALVYMGTNIEPAINRTLPHSSLGRGRMGGSTLFNRARNGARNQAWSDGTAMPHSLGFGHRRAPGGPGSRDRSKSTSTRSGCNFGIVWSYGWDVGVAILLSGGGLGASVGMRCTSCSVRG